MITRKVFYIPPENVYSEFRGNKYDYLFAIIEELRYCDVYRVIWLKTEIDKIFRFNEACIVKVELEIRDKNVDIIRVVEL